ncbi:TetR/AcrR family transcriptional regulator [Mycoplasmatota bacterium]|nr:TetR/AcrR family transcriptional regulator [Mycoplasmatota bacterium]
MDKREQKKNEILEKSINVMYEKGYNGTSVKDLTDAACIPKGSLYNYFENKEDYAKEALTYYYSSMSKEQFDILDNKNLDPLERIKKFYKKMILDVNTDEMLCKGCFVGKIAQEMSGVNDSIQEVISKIEDEIIGKLSKNIYEAQKQNMMHTTTSSQKLAEFIFNSWHGTLIRAKVTRNVKSLEDFYDLLVITLLV